MSGHSSIKRITTKAGSKKPYFNFRPNISKTLPSNIPPFSNFGEQTKKRFETPVLMANRNPNGIFLDYSKNFEDGYASAMEPMSYDEWEEEEENWNESTTFEMDINSTKRKLQISTPSEHLRFKKNVSQIPFPKVKHTPSNFQKFKEKRLLQSVLSVEKSNVISIKVDPKQRKISSPLQVHSEVTKKIFPKWSPIPEFRVNEDNDLSLPRMLTVTVEKLLNWPKMLIGAKVMFELYGILENISEGKTSESKRIHLKSETMKNRLTCTFYEIDRKLPIVEKGHWKRCIILLRCNGDYQCLKIRSAMPNELKKLDKMVTSSGKAKALLLKVKNK